MLRPVLAVVLATALVATSMPAIEAGRRDHTAARVTAELATLETVVGELRERDVAVRPVRPGARRVVSLRLPARSWSSTGLEYLAIGGVPGDNESAQPVDVAWKLPGGRERSRRLTDVRVVGNGQSGSPTEPLIIRTAGVHRLAVSWYRCANRSVVSVRRLGSDGDSGSTGGRPGALSTPRGSPSGVCSGQRRGVR